MVALTVCPSQTVEILGDLAPKLGETGEGETVIVFVAVLVPQGPLAVKVKVMLPLSLVPATYCAFTGSLAFSQEPAPPLQVPPVAPPPTEPPIIAEVAPWQIVGNVGPAFAVGVALIFIVFVTVVIPQEPPLVVSVNVTVPLSPNPAV